MPADYCGAFTIDIIDQFGTLEQILISFDNPIWNSPDTCILYGDGSVTANASATANGIRTREGAGSVTANGTVVSDAIRIRVGAGTITANGLMSGAAIRIRTSSGSITGTASVSALGGVVFSGTGQITVFATVTADPTVIYGAVATVNGIALVNCFGRILGDNWTDEATVASVWTGTTPTVTTWSNISSGNSQWQ